MKINLGGGNKKLEGFTNIDILDIPEVDIVCDVNDGIPLDDNTVEEVYAAHFFEHIPDTVALMEELYRICKPNALVRIRVPYFKSIGAFKDPTHVSFFTERTFEYFDREWVKASNLPDYNWKMDFVTEDISYLWASKPLRYLPLKKAFWMKILWNIVRTIQYDLRVRK